jgi:CO/xanthine dehydrogenase FAD-binding subunit
MPDSVEAALKSLRAAQGSTAVVAGGTDLLLDMQQGRHAPVDTLVDISRIAEMQRLDLDGEHIFLGAGVTHRRILESSLLAQHANCLVEGSGLVGGPQVRNVGTIGGNVAHALPAGDGTIALLALEAEAELASLDGRRRLPLADLFAGPGQVTFERRDELLVGFHLPLQAAQEASAFRRIMRPQGVAIAILNMAAWLRMANDGSLEAVRLAIGPAGPRPIRPVKTEALLCGRFINAETLSLAKDQLIEETSLRTSRHRATAAYRQHLVAVLLERVLTAASEQATAVAV